MKNDILKKLYEINLIIFSIITILLIIIVGFTFATTSMLLLAIDLGVLLLLFKLYKNNKTLKKLFYSLVVLTSIVTLSFLYVQVNIISNTDYVTGSENYDYIIVLGAKVNGYELSVNLKDRLDKLLSIYNDYSNAKIIVSGGQGADEIISEAEAMKNYLIENGISESIILKEDKATSTSENIIYSKKIIDSYKEKNPKSLVVSNDFHMYRMFILARKNEMNVDGLSAKTPFFIKINFSVREYYAIIKTLILD